MNTKGLRALCVESEMAEVSAISGKDLRSVRLQYLQGSAQKGLRLWNVLQPVLPGYKQYGGLNGYPTFSIQGLQDNGLIS